MQAEKWVASKLNECTVASQLEVFRFPTVANVSLKNLTQRSTGKAYPNKFIKCLLLLAQCKMEAKVIVDDESPQPGTTQIK